MMSGGGIGDLQDLIIVGASGFGRELLMTIKDINSEEAKWNVRGFIDDNLEALNGIKCSHKILGTIKEWIPDDDSYYAMAIADPKAKRIVAQQLKAKGAKFATIIHQSAHIGEETEIGEGLVMFSHTDISVNCKIGDFVFLSTFSQIGHDSIIGNYCTLFPTCSIAGGGELEEGVLIGTGASTYPNIKLGEYATVGMNSAVIRNVKSNNTVMGVPAKKVF